MYVGAHATACVRVCVCVCRSEDHLEELVLFSSNTGVPGIQLRSSDQSILLSVSDSTVGLCVR